MPNYKIETSMFFYNHRAFPWDILGYGVPKYGQVHSYLCSMLAPLANRIEKPLLESKPTMREIKRLYEAIEYAQSNNELYVGDNEPSFKCRDIFKLCERIYDKDKEDRKDLDEEVLIVIRQFPEFTNFVHERLNHLYKQGLVSVDKKYLREIIEK